MYLSQLKYYITRYMLLFFFLGAKQDIRYLSTTKQWRLEEVRLIRLFCRPAIFAAVLSYYIYAQVEVWLRTFGRRVVAEPLCYATCQLANPTCSLFYTPAISFSPRYIWGDTKKKKKNTQKDKSEKMKLIWIIYAHLREIIAKP